MSGEDRKSFSALMEQEFITHKSRGPAIVTPTKTPPVSLNSQSGKQTSMQNFLEAGSNLQDLNCDESSKFAVGQKLLEVFGNCGEMTTAAKDFATNLVPSSKKTKPLEHQSSFYHEHIAVEFLNASQNVVCGLFLSLVISHFVSIVFYRRY